MLYEKYLALDRSVVIHGSVDWSLHVVVSSGIVMVHNGYRTLRVLEAFDKLMANKFMKVLLRNDFLASTPCVYWAKRMAAEAVAATTGACLPAVSSLDECELDIFDDYELEYHDFEHDFDLDAQIEELSMDSNIEFSSQLEHVVTYENQQPMKQDPREPNATT